MSARPFSLRDLFALVIVGSVFLSLAITGCGDGKGGVSEQRRKAMRMQNGTQVRGIQQSFVLFSQSNNGYYPAYNLNGEDDFAAIPASQTQWGANALNDDDIGKVYAILLQDEYITSDYIISPLDSLTPLDSNTKGKVDNKHYSYALLDMNDADSNRRSEWRDTNNSQAPIVADPSSDIRTMETVTYHTDASGDSDAGYQGNIAWNDNHVTFETDGVFEPGMLKMGSTPNEAAVNPFKNKDKDGAKFIW